MFALIAYAVLVWYGALRWRRNWRGFLAVLLGLVGLAFVGYLHWMLNEWTNGRVYLRVLQVILYPYGALVAAVGFFIAALPTRYYGAQCRACGYDLRGLESDERTCPECSTKHALGHIAGQPCRTCTAEMASSDVDQQVCAACGTVHVLRGRGHREFDIERAQIERASTEAARSDAGTSSGAEVLPSARDVPETLREIARAQAQSRIQR